MARIGFHHVSALLLLLAGCSGGDDSTGDGGDVPGGDVDAGDEGGGGGDDGGGGPGCGFEPSGASGAATVTAGTPVAIVAKTGAAMNQLPTDFHPLPEGRPGMLARGPCGDVGLIYRDSEPTAGGDPALVYVDLTSGAGTPEVVEPALTRYGAGVALWFDADCSPVVLHAASGGELDEYVRATDGTWSSSVASGGLEAVLGGAPSSVSLEAASTAADGSWLAVLHATVAGAEHIVHARRAAAAGSAWTFTGLPALDVAEVQSWAAAADGSVHAVYTNTEYPCDPCNMDLYYGRVAAGGAWTTETVQAGRWGDPNDEFSTNAALIVDASGAPWIAATFQTRVVTGSLTGSELRFYGKRGGEWCSETVAEHSDGYAGGDGAVFTGEAPQLALDGSGRFHIVFGDVSQWHDGTGANDVPGQVRYAVRTGTAWSLATLFDQPGQTESPRPLHAFDSPVLAVSPDGADVRVAGVERVWDTDSIYNSTEMPVTLRLLAIEADITLP